MAKNEKWLENMRHSISHLMSMAVQELYPKVGLGMGPPIQDGFYQDYGLPKNAKENITDKMLPKLEKRIKEMIKQDIKFRQHDMTFKAALKFYKHDPYKTEILKDLEKAGEKKVSFYKSDWFDNLCKGPHVKSTKEIDPEAFKLTRVAGAYWKGSEKNPMLTRIYGIAFEKKKDLKAHLKLLEEAEKRDHRKLGQELDLFMIDEEVGRGLSMWLPKGAILRRIMEDFVLDEYIRRGYEPVQTPHIGAAVLYETSGHLGFYKEGMYSPMKIDEEEYYMKPMNCPMHVKIYKRDMKSYRDLPVRYTELGTVYRYERSGTLHGLLRVRGFTQDDAHIMCSDEQLLDELVGVLDLTDYILRTFGFKKFRVALSVRDPKNKDKYLGADKDWKLAEKSLEAALKKVKWPYEREEGEAVFYGPKIDLKIEDAIGREWQISTLQIDFNLPKRFDMTYVDHDGKKKRPFMLHRALLGAIERFTGVLIEHYAGAFPVWLAPVQVQIVPVSEKFVKFADQLADDFKKEGVRVEVDRSEESVGKKIRNAELKKVPYMLVIGEKEKKSGKLMVRRYGEKKQALMGVKKFMAQVKEETEKRR